MSANAFAPQSQTSTQTANVSGSLPTPIQLPNALSTALICDTVLIWNSTSTVVFLGWGATSALATANAVIPTVGTSQQTIPLPGNTVQTFRMPAGSFVCGITAAGTSAVYFLTGDGV